MFVFVTSFISPHFRPIIEEISHILNGKVIVIETMEMTPERKNMGYQDDNTNAPFEIVSLLKERDRALELINNSEVVDYGWHLVDLLKGRVKSNRLTFLENERILKRGLIKFLDLRLWKQIVFNVSSRNKNVFFLSTGDYAANEYRILGFNKDKILRFGYFPKTYFYENVFAYKTKEGPLKCIWVGRLIGWKRPLDALKAIKEIPKEKIQLVILGDGTKRKRVQDYINKHNLDNVELKGLLSINEVRSEMLNSDVLISTSSKREGWSAVINEAMNSGCAIISSNGSGAMPNLIKDSNNGFVYKSGCISQLKQKLFLLADNKELAREFGSNAYATITGLWNEKIAAKRLNEYIEEFNLGREKIFREGPCSKVY